MALERTFVMLKPGVLCRRIVGEIISRIERKGFDHRSTQDDAHTAPSGRDSLCRTPGKAIFQRTCGLHHLGAGYRHGSGRRKCHKNASYPLRFDTCGRGLPRHHTWRLCHAYQYQYHPCFGFAAGGGPRNRSLLQAGGDRFVARRQQPLDLKCTARWHYKQ